MMQLPLFEPESRWKVPRISDLPSWEGMKRISIDCETRDPHLKELGPSVRRGGYIVGVSFTIEDTNQSFYLPYRHAGGDNIPEEEVLRYLRENGRKFTGQLVGAKLDYDLDYLWADGIFFPNVSFYRDVQIAEPLIYELEMSYSLFNIGKRYGIEAKDEEGLDEAAALYGFKKNAKANIWRLPARHVGAYAERDTVSPLLILREQEKLIDQKDLWQIWNLESKLLPILVKFRQRGVRINQDKLEKICKWSEEEEKIALAVVKEQTGQEIALGNVWNNEALAPALQHIGIRLNKTTTGKFNIDKTVLKNIDHPVAHAIARARKVNKLRTTFGASIYRYMVNGRIHCTLNQIAKEDEESGDMKGARYGRLSSQDPNLQQQPSRDEFAAEWRDIYIPEEGAIWGNTDYSQQEPRWTTHFAAVMDLRGAKEAAARYRDDPSTDNHQMMSEITGIPRKKAKDIFLGLCYGEGGAKLCRDLGLPTRWAVAIGSGRNRTTKFFPTKMDALEERYKHENEAYIWEAAGEEGQAMLDTFDSRCPYVRLLAKAATAKAKQRGWIRTVGGRVLNFPKKDDGSHDWTHKALNRLIQGSSADQMKMAIVAIDEQMPNTFIQLQVHDELDGSYSSVEEAQKVADIMKNIIPNTEVPFKVDLEVGPSWGKAKPI
jgi:DNA polymerase I-like protein with 3'-5' exonuclease and polymerase domains